MVNKSRKKLGIVIPVFNDWQSLGELPRRLHERATNSECDFHLFIVDDCSSEMPSIDFVPTFSRRLASLRVIRLRSNPGHQRAIAGGLGVASQDDQLQAVVVMDADGQDRPEDVLKLVEAWNENSARVVDAEREERSERLFFRLSYAIYKHTFRNVNRTKD